MIDISLALGKDESYKGQVKRIYNKIKKEKKEEGLDEMIPPEQFQRFILLGVGKHYELDNDKIKEILDEKTEPVDEIDEDEIAEALDLDDNEDEDEDLGFTLTDDPDYGKEEFDNNKNWKDIFKTTTKSEFDGEGGFVKKPSLQILLNIGMKLKLVDPNDEPYIYDGIGKDNKPYTSYAMDVVLVDILTDDDEILEEVYNKGDFRGEKLYTKKRAYKLWLNERGFESFVEFWRDTLGLEQPDSRTFILKKSQRKSKSTGRRYNVFKFYEPR